MRARPVPAAIGVGLALWGVEPAIAASAFDGTWNVEINCPDVGDVMGYDWRFPVNVSSGALSGDYHSSVNEAMGHLSGRIRSDGQALLTLTGKTGPVQFAVGHVRPGTPFRYTANVHFEGRSGNGVRNERRACTLNFTKD